MIAGSGVYFPNRSHRVRIGAKKLRYELELVQEPTVKRTLKRLRRTQNVLGSIQDRLQLGGLLRITIGPGARGLATDA